MFKKWLGWLLLAVCTLLNVRLFLGRWAEDPRSDFGSLLSDPEVSSLVLGFAVAVVAMALLDTLRARRWAGLLALGAACAGLALAMPSLGVFKNFGSPLANFVAVGAGAALACAGLRESASARGEGSLQRSFALLFATSLNAFLLMAPWTTHVPSYVQGSLEGVSMASFYYGSVHAEASPVSAAMRELINFFFARPTINATALSSMLYLSAAIAMAGVAIEMIFGRPWGWAVLLLALSDRWLFASAISSAVVGQPVLSTSAVLLLCAWGLWRSGGVLSWREAAAIGAANAAGVAYNLYSYSAARMTWILGSSVAALVLVMRGALRPNVDGLRKAAMLLLPSAAVLLAIWAYAFNYDTTRFKGQLFVSPEQRVQIKDVNSYSRPVVEVHNPDIPIWWGSGIPTEGGEAVVLHWRRTPREIIAKLRWFMEQLSLEPPITFVLVLLGGLGVAVCLASPIPLRRWFGVCLALLTLVSFATFVLAQDHAAYRRGLATNLLLVCGAVALFASKSRSRCFKAVALGLCGAVALLKAPSELNALFHESFWSTVCARCQPVFDVRPMVNAPAFGTLADRRLHFMLRVGSPQAINMECLKLAVESNEFHGRAPSSVAEPVKVGDLSARFDNFSSGEVMVISCFPASSSDPEVAAICAGSPPTGKLLATIASEAPGRERTWWAFVEKL